MDTLQLSLRQRKLLHTLQKQDSYMTGKELADLLHVSARTIRSDITEINYSTMQLSFLPTARGISSRRKILKKLKSLIGLTPPFLQRKTAFTI